jgi:hypothetical protein
MHNPPRRQPFCPDSASHVKARDLCSALRSVPGTPSVRGRRAFWLFALFCPGPCPVGQICPGSSPTTEAMIVRVGGRFGPDPASHGKRRADSRAHCSSLRLSPCIAARQSPLKHSVFYLCCRSTSHMRDTKRQRRCSGNFHPSALCSPLSLSLAAHCERLCGLARLSFPTIGRQHKPERTQCGKLTCPRRAARTRAPQSLARSSLLPPPTNAGNLKTVFLSAAEKC